jgi:hypothetical protein
MQEPKVNPSKEYVDSILASELREHEDTPEEIKKITAPEFALANFTSGDREYFRLQFENIALYSEERTPPKYSRLHSTPVGAAMYEDAHYDPRDDDHLTANLREIGLHVSHAETSRSVDGWQQDKFSESITTNRVEDARGEEEPESRGLRGLL